MLFTKINLVVGNILKLSSKLVEAADQAINIIRWLLNHSYLLGLFHKEQLQLSHAIHTLSLPVITWWTAHFLLFTSLISEAQPLRSLVLFHSEEFLASASQSPEQMHKVKGIMKSIEDPTFWKKLTELKLYLKPLAIAANVAQAPTTRLDHILIELGCLYYTFSRFAMNSAVQTCVLNSLELRWGKSNQDPHIVSVILNPYICLGVFHPQNALLNRSSLYGTTKRVFRRLFRKDNDLEMHKAFMDYLDGKNEFHADRWDFQELQELYEQSFGLSASKQLGEAALLLPDADKEDQHNKTAKELAELDTLDKEAGTSGFKKLASKLAQDVLDDKDLPKDSCCTPL
ncbi:hypothetical protein RhiTH_010919 [Rhizoctonia solani]